MFRLSLDFFGVYVNIVTMERLLIKYIKSDLPKKIVLITGPRQCGKTTLSKMLSNSYDYFNYDNQEHRLAIHEKSWDRSKQIIILDELHKMQNWKSWLKGIYDTEKRPPALVITGSARLDLYRKMGDSLAGRFFQFRLHPFDLTELSQVQMDYNAETALETLLQCGGFPEPFLENSKRFYNRWKRSHLDIILRQDLLDLENVRQIPQIELLIQLLRRRVGSPLSYSSLAGDLQCSDKTVKRWLTILENLYIVFKVTPFHRNIARSILKSPKFYFYDTGQVIGNDGLKLENLIACALIKKQHFNQDCYGENSNLHYLRDKDGHEIDFLIKSDEGKPVMIEVKWNDASLSKNFQRFSRFIPDADKVQIVRHLDREKTYPDGAEIRRAVSWLH